MALWSATTDSQRPPAEAVLPCWVNPLLLRINQLHSTGPYCAVKASVHLQHYPSHHLPPPIISPLYSHFHTPSLPLDNIPLPSELSVLIFPFHVFLSCSHFSFASYRLIYYRSCLLYITANHFSNHAAEFYTLEFFNWSFPICHTLVSFYPITIRKTLETC